MSQENIVFYAGSENISVSPTNFVSPQFFFQDQPCLDEKAFWHPKTHFWIQLQHGLMEHVSYL